jgi:C1A family cysteine protease
MLNSSLFCSNSFDHFSELLQAFRKGLFLESLRQVNELNDRHGPCGLTGGSVFGVNNFSDYSDQEFNELLTTRPSADPSSPPPEGSSSSSSSCSGWNLFCQISKLFSGVSNSVLSRYEVATPTIQTIPTTTDWRDSASVKSEVKMQGSCGGCWAISTAQVIESHVYIQSGEWVSICASEIIACEPNTYGCDGGWPQDAYNYAEYVGSNLYSKTCEDDFAGLYEQLTMYEKDSVCSQVTESEYDDATYR